MDYFGRFDRTSKTLEVRANPGVGGAGPLDQAREGAVQVALYGNAFWMGTRHQAATARDVAARYLREGNAFLQSLGGRFFLALYDASCDELILAIDRIGVERCCYATDGAVVLFSSSCNWVRAEMATPGSVDEQRIFDFLIFHMVPSPHTIFDGIAKLEPAHFIRFGDSPVPAPYWQPEFGSETDTVAAREEFRELLEESVRFHAGGDTTTNGAFLSGGLDSSTVAGFLERVQPDQARVFSIGFGEPGYDELEYARGVVRHFGLTPHEYVVSAEDVLSVFDEIASAYDEPFGNSSAVPTMFCAKLAQEHGVSSLLAGDGGDELFGGNDRYARQKLFHMYSFMPGFLDREILQPFGKRFDETGFTPLRKLASYISQASIPMPERLESWNFFYREGRDQLSDEFTSRIATRAPLDHMQTVYDRVTGTRLLNRMLAYDWHFTLADNDLRKVGMMCRHTGVNVEYPMVDTELLEFACRLGASTKLKRLRLRAFFRDALADFLPASTLNKSKHGFGLPFGVWLQKNAQLRDMIRSYMTDLRRRGYFDEQFMDNLIAMDWSEDFSYYGYVIWDLAMLEAWLQKQS